MNSVEIYCLVYHNHTALDLIGPADFLGRIPNAALHYVSPNGGRIRSGAGFVMETEACPPLPAGSVLLVPGGMGTRTLVSDNAFLQMLAARVREAKWCLSVCTGSALLAAAGCLDGHSATSNKKAFGWASSFGSGVDWKAAARWVADGKFYTSSGVAAGMDMALGFIADQYGEDLARQIANDTEYARQTDAEQDDFAALHGLGKF